MDLTRKYVLEGMLREKEEELDALEVEFDRRRKELNILLNPFDPLKRAIELLDIKEFAQAAEDVKSIKTRYLEKLKEIEKIKKEL